MFDVIEEMMDSKESPLPLPNENTTAENFLERNFNKTLIRPPMVINLV